MNHNFVRSQALSGTLAEVGALLAQAGVQLAIAELGTAGAVAASLRQVSAAAVITSARVFQSPAELGAALRVSEAKMAAFGVLSAMVAAEAATSLIDTYEGGWGLAVLAGGGNHGAEGGVSSLPTPGASCFVALGTPSATEVVSCEPEQAVPTALALLKSAAETRLATRRPF